MKRPTLSIFYLGTFTFPRRSGLKKRRYKQTPKHIIVDQTNNTKTKTSPKITQKKTILTTAISLPAAFLNAFVHLDFRGFLFLVKFLWHLDRQNRNTLRNTVQQQREHKGGWVWFPLKIRLHGLVLRVARRACILWHLSATISSAWSDFRYRDMFIFSLVTTAEPEAGHFTC